MHLHCHLGRIAPVEEDPSANLKGAQNARKWVIDLTLPGKKTTLSFQLVDWRTGVQVKDGRGRSVLSGKLMPHCIPLDRMAARSTVFFPAAEDGNLTMRIEPEPYPGAAVPDPLPEMRFRLVVDAPNTLSS
jgi:hypothetical protein